jgi:hypothetical protein
MITIDELRQQFLDAYEGGDPNTPLMDSMWNAYLHCARLNGVVPFELPKKWQYDPSAPAGAEIAALNRLQEKAKDQIEIP